MPLSRIEKKKQRLAQLKENKRPHERIFELIARYIDMRTITFTDEGRTQTINIIPDDVINNDISHISDSSSSALLGALWPNGAGTFRIDRHRSIPDTQVNKAFFKDIINPVMLDAMDNPENGLQIAIEESISELVNYGTGSINVKNNVTSFNKPVTYRSWDIKSCFIDEDENGFIDTNYRQKQMDVGEVVKKYSIENVSANTKKLWDDGKFEDKVMVIIAVEPRDTERQTTFGTLGMPFESLHFEFDSGKILKESGFAEFPVPTARFKKKTDETWGRGSGGQALPEAIELNAIWEALTVAFEKFLDPPMGLLDDGRLGGGDIDTSASAFNVFSVDAVVNNLSSIIAPLFTVGDPSGAIVLTEKLKESISQHFMLDRLLDLNNNVEMTLGEANIRNDLRSDSLRKVYARLTAEYFIPVINRTFNILFRRGFFGVIPGSDQELEFILLGREYTYLPDDIISAILQDKDFFKIKFISPAARMLQSEEANGIISIIRLTTEAGNTFPEALDGFNIDIMLQRLSEILGISVDVLNSLEAIKFIRKNRAEANAALAGIEQAKQISEINRNNAQANATQPEEGIGL